ncbi:MAG: sodium-translocating pyrophosphatase [Planctomycetota bacterium]|jgi:K(+)-stimulated pyrophosphate-energized sodium pump|nr:sodium-translocating pyrophosphatase [Planctomycetota bacterium]
MGKTASLFGLTLLAASGVAPSADALPGAGGGTLPEILFYLTVLCSLAGLFFAFKFYREMKQAPDGTDRMREIAGYVREGAYAYLYAQYKTVGLVFVILFLVFLGLAKAGIQNPFVPVAFLTGGFFSGLCGFLGMKTATHASSRTAQGASESLNRGLTIAFRSGAVMGLVVVSFGLLDICIWYWILDNLVYTAENLRDGWQFYTLWMVNPGTSIDQKYVEITTTMLTFGMGASTQALFARVGGGIYTKAADVGADLVGKVEAGIPEDDPRNPATIADNVGDNVGDVAGMGADLYESYCGSILATAALGAAIPSLIPGLPALEGIGLIVAPMIVAGLGTVLSIVGIHLVRTEEKADMSTLLAALGKAVNWSSGLIVIVMITLWALGMIGAGTLAAVIVGLLVGIVIGKSTEYYTSDEYEPTRSIVEQCKTGPATCIIAGLGVGMLSAAKPVAVTVAGIILSYGFAGGFSGDNPALAMAKGLYGIGFAAVGMLATLGITLATDAYGPIADNAGGNAEMAGLGEQVRERTDALDMLGNTTAATGKGFAIGSAALTAMALLAAFIEEIRAWIGKLALGGDGMYAVGKTTFYTLSSLAAHGLGEADALAKGYVNVSTAGIAVIADAYDISIMNPKVLGGLFLGSMMVLVICALTMRAVGRAASNMVSEVRRQFREIAGIMDGSGKPDYAKCVAISTKGAQKEMLIPSLAAIVVPVAVGMALGVPGVMGLLAGGLTSGFAIACLLNNAGGAWDNAKKHIEKQARTYADGDPERLRPLTGKGSEQHKAGVVGDTVGDPCKDTSGPSLNILIKLMSMVCVVFSGVIVKYGDKIIPALQRAVQGMFNN